MHDGLRQRLSKEVTRKEFVQYMGFALLALFGIDNFINLLFGDTKGPGVKLLSGGSGASTGGFGSRKFGE